VTFIDICGSSVFRETYISFLCVLPFLFELGFHWI
jgi:hypothetical protein